MHTLSLCLIAIVSAAAPAKTTTLDDFHALFDPSLEKVKAKLACKGSWQKKDATNPVGKSYAVETCPDANQQVMTSEGKVFAVGIALADHSNKRLADTVFKDAQKAMLGAKCTEVRKPGQLGFYDCPSSFSVALLDNWNSKDDTETVSAMFGDTATLHSMMGLK